MSRIENPRCPGEPTVLRGPAAAHRVLAIRGIYTINASEGCRALSLWAPANVSFEGQVKLASLKTGAPDGALFVASRDLRYAVRADSIAPTLLNAIERWADVESHCRTCTTS